MVSHNKYRAEKIRYPDGVGCCLWTVTKDNEDCGICFDFPGEDISVIITLLKLLVTDEEKKYEPDLKYEEWKRKREETEKKLWYRLYTKIEDIGIQFAPFDWSFRRFFVSRPVNLKDKSEKMYKMCKGFRFGPFTVTW